MFDDILNFFESAYLTYKARRRYKRNYPKTVKEILDDEIKYKTKTVEAIMEFKKAKPWRGTKEEKIAKYEKLNHALAEVYKIPEPILVFPTIVRASSAFLPAWNIIVMENCSVNTFLHEFGHALGFDERKTCWWSINLFRKCFPKQYEKLVPKGHLLYRKKTLKNLGVEGDG